MFRLLGSESEQKRSDVLSTKKPCEGLDRRDPGQLPEGAQNLRG